MELTTYVTYDGKVLDLSGLTAEQKLHLEHAHRLAMEAIASEDGQNVVSWMDFNDLVNSEKNPLLRETQGFVTRELWEHPLYQALYDLDVRVGMKQGMIAKPRNKRWLQDPAKDQFVPVSEVAERKRVQVKAVHKAIDRGDLVAIHGEFEGDRAGPKAGLLVSWNSAKAWSVKRVKLSGAPQPVRR